VAAVIQPLADTVQSARLAGLVFAHPPLRAARLIAGRCGTEVMRTTPLTFRVSTDAQKGLDAITDLTASLEVPPAELVRFGQWLR
jgi:hypothetical protein